MAETVKQLLELSLQHHQAGRFAEAERGYQRVLRMEPRNADALHLLGLLALQFRKYDLAEHLVRKAVVLRPEVPEFLASLGKALTAAGKHLEASIEFRRELNLTPRSIPTLIRLGESLFRSGSKAEATTIFNNALHDSSLSAELIFAIGKALHSAGVYQEAAAALDRAVNLRPDYVDALNYLADSLRVLGKLSQALNALERAASLEPDYAEAHFNLAVLLQQSGKFKEAAAAYRKAIALKSDYANAFGGLAEVLAENQELEEAMAMLHRGLHLQPNSPQLQNILGQLLSQAGRLEEAAKLFERLIHAQPHFRDAHLNYGCCLAQIGRNDAACLAITRALDLDPAFAIAYANLESAMKSPEAALQMIPHLRTERVVSLNLEESHRALSKALLLTGDVDGAMIAAQRVVQIAPSSSFAHNSLARVFQARGEFEKAIAALRRAVALNPSEYSHHFELGMLLLLLEDYEQGWKEYEWRLQSKEMKLLLRSLPLPRWNGEDLKGRRILLWSEQGLGDTLQFVRFAPLVAARGGEVILACRPELESLLSGLPGIKQVITQRQPVDDLAYECPLMSLPYTLGTRSGQIPNTVPYIFPDAEIVQNWASKLPQSKLKVGLRWAGTAGHQNDRNRSLPLKTLLPILKKQEIDFVSLELGKAWSQLSSLGDDAVKLLDPMDQVNNFSDTAAIIANLDLIITVDTAVAHLAGAMGKPVWILLPFVPDWRWHLNRSHSPWYPTMRLFRQPAINDWSTVVSELFRALTLFLQRM